MPKPKGDDRFASDPFGLQAALDALDVGQWEWNIVDDCVHADALVAQLFDVDPDLARTGAPLAEFTAGIHADDRDRVMALIGRCAAEGSAYVAEYRVCSSDGRTRWLLARGRFFCDEHGRPLRGHGIVIDITQSRLAEKAYVARNIIDADLPLRLHGSVTSLEQVADVVLAARDEINRLDNRRLKVLLDMIILEIGRELVVAQRKIKRKSMQ